jgi:DNA-binding MarR family transcriptional regulator
MTIQALTWALSQPTGDPVSKLVLVTMAARGGGSDTAHVWLGGVEDLAGLCQVDGAAADEALTRLSTAGLVHREAAGVRMLVPPVDAEGANRR